MQHRIILPGATTLTRLISEVREKATLRLWNKLALIPSAEQRSQLEMLLGPTDCSRLSLLESLKKGPVTISGPAFNEAIERWKTLNDFGLHAENLSTLPAVRLKNLARYAGMTSVFNIARMSPQKRMAVLVAFVLAWETLALDDALDVLDAMLAVIIRDARKIGQKKRLRSLKDLDKSALALASACSYLLKEETPDESIRAEVFSYIPRQKLAEIITLVREIARPSDDNFHEEMVEQYGRVRRFLPHLLNTVKFSSAPAGVTTLNACDYLSREFSSRRQFFDDAPTEIISRSWKRLRKYVAIQQWFAEKHPVPFYSCIFDNAITDCYSWSISKDGYFIFGGAYPMKDGQTRFTTLKEKMSAFQFQFGKAVKSEKCTVLFPSRWQDFVCGKDNAFLIGEAAGFISASSLEGISYALDSAEILRSVLLKQPEKLNTAYWRATRKLRLKLFGKIVKSRCLTAPALRKWIMRSGVAHIPQLKDYPTRFTSPTSRM